MKKSQRGFLIAGNWKMNHSPREAKVFFSELISTRVREILKNPSLRICIAPPNVSLAAGVEAASQLCVAIAAQNTHWEDKGAYTGEISGPMLKEMGVSWSLVGHSERRQYFGETDETAKLRNESLLRQGFHTIFCVGETRQEREECKTGAVLSRQMQSILKPNPFLHIAYEPVWAIGTGLTATPAQAEEAHQQIRKNLWDRFGMEAAGITPILYGGSVTPENAEALLSCPNVDGTLVGGASLNVESFLKILEAAERVLGSTTT